MSEHDNQDRPAETQANPTVIFEDYPDESKPKDPKQKITPEDAQLQLDLLLGYYEIYPEDITDLDTRSIINTTCQRVKRAIINGRVIVEKNDKLVVQQRTTETENKTTFTYGVVGPSARRAIAGLSGSKRVNAMAASLSGTPENAFAEFIGVDISTLENLVTIFLLV